MSNQTSRLVKTIATLTVAQNEQASNIVLAESIAAFKELAIYAPATLDEVARLQVTDMDSAEFGAMQRAACSNFLGTPFTPGEALSFSPSSATATLSATDDANYIRYTVLTGKPTTSDTISGDSSGASADIDTIGAATYEDEDFDFAESPAGTPIVVSENGQTTIDRISTFALRIYTMTSAGSARVFKLLGCAPLEF